MLEKIMCDPQYSSEEWKKEGARRGLLGDVPQRLWGLGWRWGVRVKAGSSLDCGLVF